MSDKLHNVHLEAAAALDNLAPLFVKDMRLTFIARHPTKTEQHVIVTNDDMKALRDLLAAEVVKEEPATGSTG